MAIKYVSSLAAGGGSGTFASPWTLAQAVSSAGATDKVIVMADGTYNVSSNLTFAQQPGQDAFWLIGGNSSGVVDGTRPTLQASGTCTTMLTISGWPNAVENLILDCNGIANVGLYFTGSYFAEARKVKVQGFKQYGINAAAAYGTVVECEITGGVSGATAGVLLATGTTVERSWIHDNVCTGVLCGVGASGVVRNRITNNTGASSDGVSVSYGFNVLDNTIHGNGRHGINYTSIYSIGNSARGNILTGNGGYGLAFTGATFVARKQWGNNAYYGNTSGPRNSGTGSTTATDDDVTLSGLPYTNAATNDFSLNSTAGAGALCRAGRVPGALPGTGTDYLDVGALQHQDAGGGGGGSTMRSYAG